MLPLHQHLPSCLLPQLFQLVVKVEVIANIGNRLSEGNLGLHGEVHEVAHFLVTPHRHTQEAALIGHLMHALHHLMSIISVHEDQIADNAIELVGRLEHALSVMDTDLQTHSLHPLVHIVTEAQLVNIASEIISGHLHHLLTEVSRKVGAVFWLETYGIGDHLTDATPHFVDVTGLRDLHHTGKGIVESLHSGIEGGIDGSYCIPHDLQLLHGGVLWLVQHKICQK